MRTADQERPPLLPDGFHEFTLKELRALCVNDKRFADSQTRREIMGNLDVLVSRLNSHDIAGELWANGSFLTEEIDPRDVDITVRLWAATYNGGTPAQVALLDSIEGLWETDKIDGYLQMEWPEGDTDYPLGAENFAYWKKQWGISRAGLAKGIAVLRLARGMQ